MAPRAPVPPEIAASLRDLVEVGLLGRNAWIPIVQRSGLWQRWANLARLVAAAAERDEPEPERRGSADVIHSFWVPNVAGKLDMIPGRRNQLDLTPRRKGWFRGQCAEFCGTQHAHMAFEVKVDSPAEFDAWLTRQATPAGPAGDAKASRGQAVFSRTCAACHVVRGTSATGRAGPDLTHVAARRSIAAGTLPMTRGGLQGWIAQPQALKPGNSMPAIPLSGGDAGAVAHYLAGLK